MTQTAFPMRPRAASSGTFMPVMAGPVLLALSTLVLAGCSDTPTSLIPPAAGDWPVSTLAEQGLSEQPLLDLKRDISFNEYGDVHSVLIVRNGALVFEEYFGGGSPSELHRQYSVSKSVTGMLVGAAWDRGLIENLDRPLLEFFPQYESVEYPEGKDAITLRHALQMRAGLQWDEWSTAYDDPNNITAEMAQAPDWSKFVFDQPMADDPGTTFTYNSGLTNVLGDVIQAASGVTAQDFADDVLFGPLGITQRVWWETPTGDAITGWGLHLRSRDMARIGQLMLQRGVWNGQRLLSEAWIDASTQPSTQFSTLRGYGLHWWLGPPVAGDDPEDHVPSAQGWGGQYIVVIPALNAVVVTTQGNYRGPQGLNPDLLVEVVTAAAAAGS